jgi:hypothetical protein
MVLRRCVHEGCGTLTLGFRCVVHESPVMRTFPRGRAFLAVAPIQPERRGFLGPNAQWSLVLPALHTPRR